MAYYILCIFLSAFLIFQVQPMIARFILPWFGGTPAVWSTVMLFFQVLLTGGYAYAAWVMRGSRRRLGVHLFLLAASLLILLALATAWKSPITPDAALRPEAADAPLWEIFKILFLSVGLPYFLLSTNSPLIQAWFHQAYPQRTAYRLYALSNIGSLLGLVTYPLLVEPLLTLAGQGWLWSGMYSVFALLAGYGAFRTWRVSAKVQPQLASGGSGSARLEAGRLLLWIAFAAVASLLLLAVTSQITQEVAVIPFLWVLPLTIYLLSFILAFSGEKWYSRQGYLIALFVGTILVGWALGRSQAIGIALQITIYSFALFCACMVCHGELYRLRPSQSSLTTFYLMVSIGGALGGIFINFVAPYLFKGYWELPLGFFLCWLLLVLVVLPAADSRARRWTFIANAVLLGSACLIAGVRLAQQVRADLSDSLYINRNYYGVVRVRSLGGENWPGQRYALIHGVTIHGFQYVDPQLRSVATAYFGETGGGGLAILNHPGRGHGMRVGILGLGIGTLAAYGQPEDVYRFYEINPLVIQLAEGQAGYFSYLDDCQAQVEIIPGDARLSLEAELSAAGSQEYDVLVLDVFSSDSIPVHLLDREAFELYLQHLAPDGILAVHISNRHLDLIPVVWTLGEHFQLTRTVIEDPGDYTTIFHSLWVLLAREPALLAAPGIAGRGLVLEDYAPTLRLWTDDYSNLIQILK